MVFVIPQRDLNKAQHFARSCLFCLDACKMRDFMNNSGFGGFAANEGENWRQQGNGNDAINHQGEVIFYKG